jgi:hypothetical protein
MPSVWRLFAITLAISAQAADDQNAARAWRVLPLIADGKIHSGWAHTGWGGFGVDHGTLRTDCDPRGMGLLVYTREKFGDTQIRAIYRTEKPQSNSGVYVRIDDGILKKLAEKSPGVTRLADGKLAPEMIEKLKAASEKQLGAWYAVHHGFEVQIQDGGDSWHRTGAIYSLAEAAPLPKKPQSEWRTMIITLQSEQIRVEVDGEAVSNFDASAAKQPPRKSWSEPIREIKRPTHGYIGLQNHDPGDVVWFKEVAVRSLAAAPSR